VLAADSGVADGDAGADRDGRVEAKGFVANGVEVGEGFKEGCDVKFRIRKSFWRWDGGVEFGTESGLDLGIGGEEVRRPC